MALSKNYALVSTILKSNDPFVILGASKFAGKGEIDRCFKYTMSKVHPDKNDHPLATKAAQKVNVSRDTLLGRNSTSDHELHSEINKMYSDIGKELKEIVGFLKYLLYPIIALFAIWVMYLCSYIFAEDWSLKRTVIHTFERRTNFFRIRYYTLSEHSSRPSENDVSKEYVESIFDCCMDHLATEPWYGLLFYFPENDHCTEGKLMIIYLILSAVTLKYLYNYLRKLKHPPHVVDL